MSGKRGTKCFKTKCLKVFSSKRNTQSLTLDKRNQVTETCRPSYGNTTGYSRLNRKRANANWIYMQNMRVTNLQWFSNRQNAFAYCINLFIVSKFSETISALRPLAPALKSPGTQAWRVRGMKFGPRLCQKKEFWFLTEGSAEWYSQRDTFFTLWSLNGKIRHEITELYSSALLNVRVFDLNNASQNLHISCAQIRPTSIAEFLPCKHTLPLQYYSSDTEGTSSVPVSRNL